MTNLTRATATYTNEQTGVTQTVGKVTTSLFYQLYDIFFIKSFQIVKMKREKILKFTSVSKD